MIRGTTSYDLPNSSRMSGGAMKSTTIYLAEARRAAIASFKDWSNYLLVTTVAALGWVSTENVDLPAWSFVSCVGLLTASVIFGIFTLAIIPLVTEKLGEDGGSIYDEGVSFKLVLYVFELRDFHMKSVCWWQHLFFILGIGSYGVGVVCAYLGTTA